MINYRRDCGGCEGKGAHWRWCAKVVGERSWFLGCLGDEADHLADAVGSNNTSAANHLYSAAGLLHQQAIEYDQRSFLGGDAVPRWRSDDHESFIADDHVVRPGGDGE